MKTCGYIVSGCCHFILPQNLPKETPHNRARPDLPDFPGTRPLDNGLLMMMITIVLMYSIYACRSF